MSEKKIPTGGFGWEELQSKDLTKAIPFYTELMGWESQVFPTPGGDYHVLLQGKEGRGGAQQHQPELTGDFCHWLSYVIVDDVDAVSTKATELGGQVLVPPHEIPDVGRSALLKDPEGIHLAVITFVEEAREPANPMGAFCWRELVSRDPEKASAFYTGLFGWSTRSMDMGPAGAYTVWQADGTDIGGMMKMDDDWGDVPAHWMPYLAVPDVDALAEKARTLGGNICVPPTDIPGVGRFAVIDDPANGTVSIITFPESS